MKSHRTELTKATLTILHIRNIRQILGSIHIQTTVTKSVCSICKGQICTRSMEPKSVANRLFVQECLPEQYFNVNVIWYKDENHRLSAGVRKQRHVLPATACCMTHNYCGPGSSHLTSTVVKKIDCVS